MTYIGFTLVLQTTLGECNLCFRAQGITVLQTLFGFACSKPASGARGDDILSWIRLLCECDVARRECNTGQLTTTGIADGGTTTVPVWNVVEGDIQRITGSRYRDLLIRARGLGL